MAQRKSVPAVIPHPAEDLTQLSWGELQAVAEAGGLDTFTSGSDLIDKGTLIGVPFVLLAVEPRTDAATARDYNTYRITTEGGPGVFNDGGSGIGRQVESLYESGGHLPVYVPKGLRVSEYTTTGKDGKPVKAATYYLA